MEFLRRQSKKFHNNPWRPVVYYMIFGVLWILFSDNVLSFLVNDRRLYEAIQTYKGITYVIITGILLYGLIRHDARKTFKLAYYDELTTLPNRASFDKEIRFLIKKKVKFSVYVIDINDFKHLNEIHGHSYGDLFLKQFGSTIKELKGLKAYRWWGDQFLLIEMTNNIEDIKTTIQNIQEKTHVEWQLEDVGFRGRVSIGVSSFPLNSKNFKSINQNLDIAIYKAKSQGKANYQIYSQELSDEVQYFSVMEDELNSAMKNDDLELFVQPIYDLSVNRTTSYEVLLRWFNDKSIFNNIGQVIQAAEKTRQVSEIDKWVVNHLFHLISKNKSLEETVFHVNLSSASFNSDDFYKFLVKSVNKYQINARNIVLEITEHSIVRDFDKTSDVMRAISEIGFRIALDDFGTKYSSLSYLSKLPFDILKIDKTYIDNIIDNDNDKSIIDLIIKLGERLELEVIAEGIEKELQNKILNQMNCGFGQGYYYARPVSIEQLINKQI